VNKPRQAVALLVLMCWLGGCNRRDQRELKHETQEAGRKLKQGAHEAAEEARRDAAAASREIKKDGEKLKREAQSK